MLGGYPRSLQDYSKIIWSTFQPWDNSSILEDFRLVELGDAQGLLPRPSILLEDILLDYKVLRGLSYGYPKAHYTGGY
jgi:hypothetical protein